MALLVDVCGNDSNKGTNPIKTASIGYIINFPNVSISSQTMLNQIRRRLATLPLTLVIWQVVAPVTLANSPRTPDETVECELLVVGGGLAGTAAAYEGLLAGKTVCLTEITDWVGGQLSAQGTSALDERPTQRSKLIYPRGYLELRERIKQHYGELNPGDCWVSESCFLPGDGHKILKEMLEDAAREGNGTLNWFPSTVIKELEIDKNPNGGTGQQIMSAIAIQHTPAENEPPLNTYPLSQTIEDAYTYEDSERFEKTIIQFIPKPHEQPEPCGLVCDRSDGNRGNYCLSGCSLSFRD